jgi:ligand-binding sensor domain-containing protein
MDDVAFAPDGAIWAVGPEGLFRLGQEQTFPLPGSPRTASDLTAAPDGTLWAALDDGVASFRDGVWTMAPAFPARAIEVTPDGHVWASSGSAVARLDDGVWTAARDDDGAPIPGGGQPRDLAASRDGWLWVRDGDGLLHRHDGTSWETLVAPVDLAGEAPIAAGLDGEVWVYEPLTPPPSCGHGHYDQYDRLARYDEDGWTVSPHPAPRIEHDMCYYGYMAVGSDGRLWATNGDRVAVYDGSAWVEVLGPSGTEFVPPEPSSFQVPLEVAPDGSLWLSGGAGFIVIDPSTWR